MVRHLALGAHKLVVKARLRRLFCLPMGGGQRASRSLGSPATCSLLSIGCPTTPGCGGAPTIPPTIGGGLDQEQGSDVAAGRSQCPSQAGQRGRTHLDVELDRRRQSGVGDTWRSALVSVPAVPFHPRCSAIANSSDSRLTIVSFSS